MPRTESPKKRRIRFCGDCGYELARDNDGTCPMCPRFQQLRLDFTVPRPSDLAAHRAASPDTDVAGAADEWPPTVAEYRAILAERRLKPDSADSAARVVRESAMRQTRVPPAPPADTAPRPSALKATDRKAEEEKVPSPSGKKDKVRRGKGKDRRAARARSRSSPGVEPTKPPALAWSAPLRSEDLLATPGSSEPPEPLDPETVRTVAAVSEVPPVDGHVNGPLVLGVSREPQGLRFPTLGITVAIVVLSAFTGAAVTILLSLPW